MDKVLNALKCSNCRNILEAPVVLSCGHTICLKHTQVTDKYIICSECGSSHENNGEFVVSKALADMIEAKLSSLYFGPQYKESVKSVKYVREQLKKNGRILDDSNYFIHESIGELRNKVLLKSEQLKVRIEEITRELLDDLDKYESECKENRNGFVSFVDKFKRQNKKAEKSCEKWTIELNELKVDDHKWKRIKEESEKELIVLCQNLKEFEQELLINEFDNKKYLIESFENANIDAAFNLVTVFLWFYEI